MREIKFRAWVSEQDEMVYPDADNEDVVFVYNPNGFFTVALGDLDNDGNPIYIDYDVSATTMQYIGLHDKNKTEIYEHDLVTISGEDEEVFEVKWDNDTSRFIMESKTLSVDFDNYYGYECEIIGNIYENQKLLQSEV